MTKIERWSCNDCKLSHPCELETTDGLMVHQCPYFSRVNVLNHKEGKSCGWVRVSESEKEETMSETPCYKLASDSDEAKAKLKMGENYQACIKKRFDAGEDPLRLCIEKYEYLVGGGQGLSIYGDSCALCMKHSASGCTDCPVQKVTGKADCGGTPWRDIQSEARCMDVTIGQYGLGRIDILSEEGFQRLLPYYKRELQFLIALRDEDRFTIGRLALLRPKKTRKTYTFTIDIMGTYNVQLNSDDIGSMDEDDARREAIRVARHNYGMDDIEFSVGDVEVEEEEVDDDDDE